LNLIFIPIGVYGFLNVRIRKGTDSMFFLVFHINSDSSIFFKMGFIFLKFLIFSIGCRFALGFYKGMYSYEYF
jgi:hypothetical protein